MLGLAADLLTDAKIDAQLFQFRATTLSAIPPFNNGPGQQFVVDTTDRVDYNVVRNAAIAMTQQVLDYGSTPADKLLAPTGLFGLGFAGL